MWPIEKQVVENNLGKRTLQLFLPRLMETLFADLLSNEWKIWTDRLEAVRTLRFSFDGNIVELEENVTDTRSLSQNASSNSDVHNFSVKIFCRT